MVGRLLWQITQIRLYSTGISVWVMCSHWHKLNFKYQTIFLGVVVWKILAKLIIPALYCVLERLYITLATANGRNWSYYYAMKRSFLAVLTSLLWPLLVTSNDIQEIPNEIKKIAIDLLLTPVEVSSRASFGAKIV